MNTRFASLLTQMASLRSHALQTRALAAMLTLLALCSAACAQAQQTHTRYVIKITTSGYYQRYDGSYKLIETKTLPARTGKLYLAARLNARGTNAVDIALNIGGGLDNYGTQAGQATSGTASFASNTAFYGYYTSDLAWVWTQNTTQGTVIYAKANPNVDAVLNSNFFTGITSSTAITGFNPFYRMVGLSGNNNADLTMTLAKNGVSISGTLVIWCKSDGAQGGANTDLDWLSNKATILYSVKFSGTFTGSHELF